MNAMIEAILKVTNTTFGIIAVEYETQIEIIFNFQSFDTYILKNKNENCVGLFYKLQSDLIFNTKVIKILNMGHMISFCSILVQFSF